MKNALHVAILIVTVVLLIAAILVAIEAALLFKDFRIKGDEALDQLHATLTDTRRTIIIVGGAATNIERTTRTWQAKQNAIADQTVRSEADLDALLKSLDRTTNSISSLVMDQDQQLSALETGLSKSITQMGTLSSSANATVLHLNETATALSSTAPAILANVQSSTAHIDATTADIQQVADAFRSDYLKPKKRLWLYFRTVLGLGASAGSISRLAQ